MASLETTAGWMVIVSTLLSTPAMAGHCGSDGCWSDDDDGGLGIKPWMIPVYIVGSALSAGELEGCRRDVSATLEAG